MSKYIYLQLLSTALPPKMDEEDGDDNASPVFCCWADVDSVIDESQISTGTIEEFSRWLAEREQPIVLVIPGEKVVVHRVAYHEKEKRHFATLLPYEMEEHIINDVDSLHFAVGIKEEPLATIAYVDEQWFEWALQQFSNEGITIDRCFIDFQLLKVARDKTVFWFCGDQLLMHDNNGVGFSTTRAMAPTLLQTLLLDYKEDSHFDVYVTPGRHQNAKVGAEAMAYIERLFHTLAPEVQCEFHSQYPDLVFDNQQSINLCSGKYGKKIPVSQWVKEFRSVAILAMVSIVTFFAVNLSDIYSLHAQNVQKRKDIEAAYRSIIPQGVVNDPVRQLTRKLGQNESNSGGEPSQTIYLLSVIAPIIQSLKVDLSTMNYSNKEQSMRINVQADSFSMIERLRSDISAKGLQAELINSNEVDNKHQARLRISLGAR